MKSFQQVAVLGAGVMGAQIAAHFANAGLIVYLLDLPSEGKDRSATARGAIAKLKKLKPSPIFTEATLSQIIPGNFDDHLKQLKNCDFILEAIIEKLDIKKDLWANVCAAAGDQTIFGSNTSGLPLSLISADLDNSAKERFLGVHFFNPPRYQKLLEITPTTKTTQETIDRVSEFGRIHLGKGIVIAKDTPNFIGNRIGCYAMQKSMMPLFEDDYSIEEVDALSGLLLGRPKSATFRTMDVVGIDTLLYVGSNLRKAIPNDESRDEFLMPEVITKMVQAGHIGAKVKKGFYSKVGKEILSIDLETLEYKAPKEINLPNFDEYRKIYSLKKRLVALYNDSGRIGAYVRKNLLAILSYSARRIPEITESPRSIDQAMCWGWAWQMGPFQIWETLGIKKVIADMKADGFALPEWIDQVDPVKGFYADDNYSAPSDEINVKQFINQDKAILKNYDDALLINSGDGIAIFQFTGKANTISTKVVKGLMDAVRYVENDNTLIGLLIANDSELFSAGANLAEMVDHVVQRNFQAIDEVIRNFQLMTQVIHYSSKPVIPVLQGRAFGGACEIIMSANHVVAASESYIGLVELGVGLIPGGAGCMRMAKQAAMAAANPTAPCIEPFLRQNWQTVAMATVSTSARKAQELRYLPNNATIVMNFDRRLQVARDLIRQVSSAGYLAPPKRPFMALGRPAAATLRAGAFNMVHGRFISEYDAFLANKLAHAMTGGALSSAQMVSEDYMLDVERETFLSLLGEKKTHERIESILKNNRPLRN
jgi:3-hydroxyacyl-CoA dehydrogenase